MITVAVLGGWHVHARDYARRVLEHPETELVAVWDDVALRGRALAAELDVAYADDLQALLARDDLDGVSVTTATADHHAVLTAAAEAGKHIFTEKLLAPTVAEAMDVIAAADRQNVRLMVSLPRLAHGSTVAIADLLDRKDLGEVTYARVRLAHDGGTRGWLPDRFFDPAAAIGGALTDLGCHPVYLVQRLLGPAPQTVGATYGFTGGRAVEDNAVVTLGYSDGAIGVIEASFVARSTYAVEIGGAEGAVRFIEGAGLWLSAGDDSWTELPVPPDGDDPFAQWVRHITDGTRADDNLARAVELTRLVPAANAAAAAGTTLAYPSP
jgi:1,5-anhydro-D-fructose reductase (1,5-anhydro-D-mannitol-forming)